MSVVELLLSDASMITGVNHITLAVRNLDRSVAFYRDVLAFRLRARWKTGAYLLAGDVWSCLSVDDATRESALPEYTHIALTVGADDFDGMRMRIQASAASWKDNSSEGDSFYFLDPDGHKLEIHSSDLETRLRHCRQQPYDGMVFFD